MGRIDEALRRVNSGEDRVPGAAVAAQEASPWTFTEAGAPQAQSSEAEPPEETSRLDRPSLLGDQGNLALFRGFDTALAERLVVSKNGSPAVIEQFRHLAATLHHAQIAQGLRTVLVTSASTGDGKSLTATNLALTLSESYRRNVLLVDADLRRPSLHQVFQVPNVSGLNEGLKARAEEKLTLLQITDALTLLPAGRPENDPMSGLSSDRMRRILQEAAARFDWVIVDTPPLGLLADAGILAGMVETALIVVRAGVTPYQDVQAAVAAVGRERVLGIVLNAVEPGSVRADYYNHYYHGSHRGSEPSAR